MSYEIKPHYNFLVEAKKLKKRYHSFESDLEAFKESLQKDPFQGDELYPGIRQMARELGFKV